MSTYAYKAVLKYGKAIITSYFSDLETAVDELIEYIAVSEGKNRRSKEDEDARSEIMKYLQDIINKDRDAVWTVRLNDKGDDGHIDIARFAVRTGRNEIVSRSDIIKAMSGKQGGSEPGDFFFSTMF